VFLLFSWNRDHEGLWALHLSSCAIARVGLVLAAVVEGNALGLFGRRFSSSVSI